MWSALSSEGFHHTLCVVSAHINFNTNGRAGLDETMKALQGLK